MAAAGAPRPRPGRAGDGCERRLPADARPGPGVLRDGRRRPRELGPPGPRGRAAPARARARITTSSSPIGDDRAVAGGRARLRRRPGGAVRRAGRPGDPRRLAPDVADRLRAHLPVVRRWAEQVAALGLPLTLNHNDLHENNVFDVDGRLRFFDFGDSLLTDPLGVMLIPLNVLGEKLQADDRRPTPVAGGRRRARGLELTSRRPRSCATRFPPRSSWVAWAGSSRG